VNSPSGHEIPNFRAVPGRYSCAPRFAPSPADPGVERWRCWRRHQRYPDHVQCGSLPLLPGAQARMVRHVACGVVLGALALVRSEPATIRVVVVSARCKRPFVWGSGVRVDSHGPRPTNAGFANAHCRASEAIRRSARLRRGQAQILGDERAMAAEDEPFTLRRKKEKKRKKSSPGRQRSGHRAHCPSWLGSHSSDWKR